MDKVNDIDMEFVFKKRRHSPETRKLHMEGNKNFEEKKLRIVGKGQENERIQEFRPSQQGRKEVGKLNTEIYNRLIQYCENIGTTPL